MRLKHITLSLVSIPVILLAIGCTARKAYSLVDQVEVAEVRLLDVANVQPLADADKAKIHAKFHQIKTTFKDPKIALTLALEDAKVVGTTVQSRFADVDQAERKVENTKRSIDLHRQLATQAAGYLSVEAKTLADNALSAKEAQLKSAEANLAKAKALVAPMGEYIGEISRIVEEAGKL